MLLLSVPVLSQRPTDLWISLLNQRPVRVLKGEPLLRHGQPRSIDHPNTSSIFLQGLIQFSFFRYRGHVKCREELLLDDNVSGRGRISLGVLLKRECSLRLSTISVCTLIHIGQ